MGIYAFAGSALSGNQQGCVFTPDTVELQMQMPDSLVAALPGRALREIVVPAALALHPVLEAKVTSTKVWSNRLELHLDAGALFRP